MAKRTHKIALAVGSAMLLSLTAACTPEGAAPAALPAPPIAQPGTEGSPYRALGTEPFWSIEINPDALVYTPMDGEPIRMAPYSATPTANGWHYESPRIRIDIDNRDCSDGMSDIVHRDTVRAEVDGTTLNGCGGGGADLSLDGTRWQAVVPAGVVGWKGAEIAFINGQMTGMVGCRTLKRPYILGDDWIAFGNAGDSANGCPANLRPFERDFMPIFETRANVHQGNEGELILSDGHNEMRFVPTTFCETKCAPIAEVAPLDGEWRIAYIDGSYIKPDDQPRYSLTFSDGRMSAQTGCNRINARYAIKDGAIRIGESMMTRMACPGEAGEHEAAFLDLTGESFQFQTSPEGHLLLSNGIHVFEARLTQ